MVAVCEAPGASEPRLTGSALEVAVVCNLPFTETETEALESAALFAAMPPVFLIVNDTI